MTELGVLRVGDVEVVLDDQPVQEVFGHLAMDREVVVAPGELRDRAAAGDDRERRDAGDREGFDVVAAEKNDDVGLGLVEHLAELGHPGRRLIELLGFFIRRPREHVRRVTGADCRDYLSHRWSPLVWQVRRVRRVRRVGI